MKVKFYYLLFLILLLSSSGFCGNLQGKKAVKKITGLPGSQALTNVTSNLNSFLQKTGLKAFQQGSLSSSKGQSTQAISSIRNKLNLPFAQSGSGNMLNIRWNKESGTPRYIEVSPNSNNTNKAYSILNMASGARNFLIENKSILKIQDPLNELQLSEQKTDTYNMSHLKFKQTYKGLEVWAKELIVHFDNKGIITSINGIYEPTPETITDINGKINSSEALDKAASDIRTKSTITGLPDDIAKIMEYQGPLTKKIIWHDDNHIPHLAWFAEVRSDIAHDWYYFIDANSGQILCSYNNVCYDGAKTATAKDLNGVSRTFGTYQVGANYFLADASQPMYNAAQSKAPDGMIGAIIGLDLRNKDFDGKNPLYFTACTNNDWTDPAAVSAHYNAIVTYNYFLKAYNRNSIDDKGMTIYSTVHVTEDGQSMENAFWSGKLMCYGDGGSYFKPLAGGLDVAAHEMTHGVTEYSAGLEYRDQSGALNESMSDVFGALVDTLNWQMGELIVKDTKTFPSGALRDLSNPHNNAAQGSGAWQPSTMNEFVKTQDDNGGVHVNSGIPNYAFYLTAKSIGRLDAGKIWYRALTVYMTKSSQFADARLATEKAATDIFGANSNQLAQVKKAWDGVGVNEGGTTAPPPTSTLQGAEWILVTNTDPADVNSIYMAKTTLTSNSDIFPLSKTPVMNRPAVSDASGMVIFVDNSNNLRALVADPKNPQETILDNSGIWNSVAIGPGLNALALTSIYQDTAIYYIDMVNNISKVYKIATKSYDAEDSRTALYADELSFEPTGKYLLFDSYNELKNANGSKISFWAINILDIQKGYMDNVFPPQSEGINVGNPSYSKTSSTRFTFDYFDSNKGQDYVCAADFNTGDIATVAGPLSVTGIPTYSADDKTIAYHTTETISGQAHHSIEHMPLKDNYLEGTGAIKKYAVDATYPNWFVIGSRTTTDVNEKGNTVPTEFKLSQNFPNPFNPSTEINFQISKAGHVQLKVYNILGREVATLVDEIKAPGTYSVSFNSQAFSLPSGIYLYRLTESKNSDTKKMVIMK